MFAAKQNQNPKLLDATGLPRGASRSLLFSFEREPPRPKAVASGLGAWAIGVATSVTLHGTSPWHLWAKPVASLGEDHTRRRERFDTRCS